MIFSLFYVFIGSIISMSITYGASFFAAQILSVEEFSRIYFIVNNVNLLSSILQISLGYALVKFVSEYREGICYKSYLSYIEACFVISNRILVTFAFLLTFFLIIEYYFSFLNLKNSNIFNIIVIGFNSLLLAAFYVRVSVSAALEDFFSNSLFLLIVPIVSTIALIVYFQTKSLEYFAIFYSFFNFFCFILVIFFNRVKYKIIFFTKNVKIRSKISQILLFSTPAAISGFVTMGVAFGYNIYITSLPDGNYIYGLIAVLISFKALLLSIPQLVNRILLPYFSRLWGKSNDNLILITYRRSIIGALLLGLFLCTILFLIGEYGVLGLYGNKYSAIASHINILGFIILFDMLFQAMYQIIQMQGKMWWSLFYLVIPREFIFIVIVMLTPIEFIILGTILAFLASSIFSCVVLLFINKILMRS